MISFFASKIRKFPSGHLAPFSSVIRGEQVAKATKSKFNPILGYEDDVCIYVKSYIYYESKQAYVDIVDGWGLVSTLKSHPNVPVIVCSELDYQTLSKVLPNKIVFIPQHHCNFEKYRRDREGISRVGIIGTNGAWKYIPQGLESVLGHRDIELEFYSSFTCRKDVVDFYRNIDLQIVWRPYSKHLSNPLKIVNAASFGIPTIAWAEDAFEEVDDCYLAAGSMDQILKIVDSFQRSPGKYEEIAQRCILKSEKYHISKIAEMYKELDQ